MPKGDLWEGESSKRKRIAGSQEVEKREDFLLGRRKGKRSLERRGAEEKEQLKLYNTGANPQGAGGRTDGFGS